ncbi:hypothetical protein FOB58_000969 [Candida parapsilosis]|uniref:Ubiquitin-like domain-containing protein n=2 Tax=Candida parapsilosis TaxID=5480 RepID=G8BG21_CANPC|nr:uncharacterized protein CPAR2_204480 [Candida parapsilosis]KAF6055047.1 hypothetical protein FOB58_000969 [Candida parapsilosis]KAF6055930.1 hypothetical protein FOB59_000442 [Candida parapsilosis]KAF6058860.1 hypothetical protein FOB60_000442 [Candida parapsilosis]KAF6067617.1 hypothetical protein FOB61_000442 [Candida parapsilosis]KAI5901847.1 DSC E3 ubiquitin ligase complex subunit 3 [Candida parapsilosis]
MRLVLVIRFTNALSSTEQIPDLSIPISINFDKDDVNKLISTTWLKSTIRSKLPQCSTKRLKLIYNGRVLNEKTDLAKEVFKPRLAALSENDLIYIHCVVSEELTRKQLEDENKLDNKPQEVTTTPNVIGFDRLLQQGFSREDVNDLRQQFYQIYGHDSAGGASSEIADLEEDETRQRNLRQLEERWIESTSNNDATDQEAITSNTASAGPETADQVPPQTPLDTDETRVNEDLLLGFCLGVFLGVISVVFLLIDDTVFNKRQKMAIIAGLAINFSLALVRGLWL